MGIHVRLEDEHHQILADLITSQELTAPLLRFVDASTSPCLAFVDSYGNTIFNAAQMKVLIDELNVTKEKVTDEELREQRQEWLSSMQAVGVADYAALYPLPNAAAVRAHANAIIELAREGLRLPHRYLCFIGD